MARLRVSVPAGGGARVQCRVARWQLCKRIPKALSSGVGPSLESVNDLNYHAGVSADPADLLRRRRIQVTAQRLAVLRAVAGQPHITADRVAEVVRGEIGAISLQSVYDALGVLVGEGLLRRIQPAGSPARFENRVGDNHHHLICRVCGRVVDVECAAGAAPCLAAADDQGYEIDEAEVAYWGRCPECVTRSTAPSGPSAPAHRRRSPRTATRAEGASIRTTRRKRHTPD
jgi:Fur family ferric uptake transcriptional regulator